MIYADYNGSAPLHPEVKKFLANRLQNGPYANPNTLHSLGTKVHSAMEKCRFICAEVLGAKPEQIIFNSGASEGISTIFHHELEKRKDGRNIIVISSLEHSAVLNSAKYYEEKGYTLKIIPAHVNGQIDFNQFEQVMKSSGDKVALVSIMAANNETGVIQPTLKIAKMTHEYGAKYFSDSTQYIGKAQFNFEQSEMDYAVLSGHKVGALVGSGLILVKNAVGFTPLIHGGGQENGFRGGTQNYIGIETLAVALNAFRAELTHLENVRKTRLAFEEKIKKDFSEVVIIGESSERLAGTSLISYPGIHGQAVQIELESVDIFVSTSSACSDNEPVTSKVLLAMGISETVGRSVIRISFGLNNAEANYDSLYRGLILAYNKLKKIQSF
ncbi:MAG: cysteine desulfurase family protein [Bacteriovoracaceae bacterium]